MHIEGEKMKAVQEIVALYQGRELNFEEELEGCLRERYRVERERRGATDTNVTSTVEALKREVLSRLSHRERDSLSTHN